MCRNELKYCIVQPNCLKLFHSVTCEIDASFYRCKRVFIIVVIRSLRANPSMSYSSGVFETNERVKVDIEIIFQSIQLLDPIKLLTKPAMGLSPFKIILIPTKCGYTGNSAILKAYHTDKFN